MLKISKKIIGTAFNTTRTPRVELKLLILVSLFFSLIFFKSQFTIIGLDNFSPYWGLGNLYSQIATHNFFYFGPGIFLTPILIFARMLPNWVFSQILFWGIFESGIIGAYSLGKFIQKKYSISIYIFLIFYSFTLISTWLLSHPSILFMSLWGGFPWTILFLVRNFDKSKISHYLIFILAFMFTGVLSFNPISFILFFIQIIILAILLKPTKIKKILSKTLILSITILLSIQFFILIFKGPSLITTEIFKYAQEQMRNPNSHLVTESLQITEQHNNSITNVTRFATGWIELNSLNGNSVFPLSNIYRSSYIVAILQLFPYIILIIALAKNYNKKHRYLLIFLVISIILQTKYIQLFFTYIPFGEALRWTSSKIWPIQLFLSSFLASIYIPKLLKKMSKWKYLVGLILGFVPTLFTFIPTNLYTNDTRVFFPTEYSNLSVLDKDQNLLVLPDPQVIYFRKYNWGYYGTDFVSFMTDAYVIDKATNRTETIDTYLTTITILNTESCPKNLYIMWDKTVSNNKESLENYIRTTDVLEVTNDNKIFTLYKCKTD